MIFLKIKYWKKRILYVIVVVELKTLKPLFYWGQLEFIFVKKKYLPMKIGQWQKFGVLDFSILWIVLKNFIGCQECAKKNEIKNYH